MQTRISSISSWISTHKLWILSLGASALVLLVLLPNPRISNANRYSMTNSYDYGYSFPVKLPSKSPDDPPVLAYCIFGSEGDGQRMLRLLKAIYHPRNQYLLYLQGDSSSQERSKLARSVESTSVFRAFGNVNVVGKSYTVNWIGASGLAAVLHAAALLLKLNADWDWFTTLSASDYPLLKQDDILYAFSSLPRDVNFVQYTNSNKPINAREIFIDSSLYQTNNSTIFRANETRETPDAFNVFRGSKWMILSRSFVEHCVSGWDNLPRKLLLYFTNVKLPLESYFHTLICNSPLFQNTTLNHNLRYTGDDPPLVANDTSAMISSQAIFAGPFDEGDDRVLGKLDMDVLNREPNGLVQGKWCTRQGMNETLEYWRYDIDTVEEGINGVKLSKLLSDLAAEKRVAGRQCRNNV